MQLSHLKVSALGVITLALCAGCGSGAAKQAPTEFTLQSTSKTIDLPKIDPDVRWATIRRSDASTKCSTIRILASEVKLQFRLHSIQAGNCWPA